ncbi:MULTISPECIES: nuclear transport factor 2 family protein [unclassified Shewanella]|uniref:nuclear transport factor 2 family protein n=1 Tax=unclassified Shewanella TaxID=196818 RepID=UPI0026E20F08|nr:MULTISPECIES: nuclear transport factor 2 family protein [unclassified Shewanella]MDO6621089.1 nuclear transport factor 2 family protein [Shewanella sp. 6_MG-2023]MDO6680654.1 nuclear transport factor 2 family protein [Shewanella sp. 4_MG-2023]
MKKAIALISFLFICLPVVAEEFDLTEFGESYFAAWKATQAPDATQNDIEYYLSFLKEDVGHQHLPYANDDSRIPTGKQDMRNGMQYYLGAHTQYSAKLNEIVPAYNVVVIKYFTQSSGIHPQTKEVVNQSYDTMEVLEIEDGKVSVIRKYSE